MDPLEYAEEEQPGEEVEDLFGDADVGPSVNAAVPIALKHNDLVPSLPASPPISAGPSRPSAASRSAQAATPLKQEGLAPDSNEYVRRRITELRMRKGEVEKPPAVGCRSLKALAMDVVKANAGRIWDVGDVAYSLLKPFIDDLDATQLDAIEQESLHLKKDTDWLWELFMLMDYPLFHERCRERKGEPRTSGWRRMYAKAIEDDEERRQQAVQKMSDRYKQLDAERASKRVIMVDRVIPTLKGKGGKKTSRAGTSGSAYAQPVLAISKLRQQSQQARLALTHASGRFAPPTSARLPVSSIARVAHAPPSQGQRPAPSAPPPASARIPPPRPSSKAAAKSAVSSSRSEDEDDLIPGSVPTSQYRELQAALPSHLRSSSSPVPPTKTAERFVISANKPKQLKQVHRPIVQNFEAPAASSSSIKSRGVGVDFFGGLATPKPQAAEVVGKEADVRPALAAPSSGLLSVKLSPAKRPMTPEMEQDKLESLMFRKKKPRVSAK